MSDKIKDIELDIEELKKLSLEAERPNILSLLANKLSALKTQLELLQKVNESPKKTQVPEISKTVTKIPIVLTKYAWDQEGTKIKLFFTLENVGNQIKADQVEFNCGKDSIEFKLLGYKGQNYIFAVKKLFAEIIPAECKYILKANAFNVVLVKRQNKHWSQIAYKEDTLKEDDKKGKQEDAGDGIMNLMKKMYNEGDDNMKKTIAEAWTKANDKKQKPHDFSDRFDFMKK